ncbi:hypothetical protein EJ05DRAFT_473048 [Pseudovirgaria hyperparasitica]|uniref:Uncharacterized protein n=1 Tax=Pseudovirgaria hyperparasitica TaxID=470096 RepID=A0A6A6WJ19_9PEZI|nr:uncharacterized protein EJ05DRAFT_473048 [Pseudovirgaria hyperparasitica]KAF2762110.1 hypothetical protein EJ05DRAFT_473048 [Pseudovirgaria hyperparasitica]
MAVNPAGINNIRDIPCNYSSIKTWMSSTCMDVGFFAGPWVFVFGCHASHPL